MPKTKDAFALRDFDDQRILQRPYFKDFNFPVASDERILLSYDITRCPNAAIMNQKFDELREVYTAVAKYRRLILKQRKKLNLVCKRYREKNDEAKIERSAGLILKYNWFEEACELFELKFGSYFVTGEQEIETQTRREFSERLRQARKDAGLTQKQLAAKIGMSQGGYTQYENVGREPSLTTLAKLSRTLKRPTDWLIGLTP